MEEEREQLNRRGFLRLSGAGAVIAGTKAIFPSQLFSKETPAELTDRTAASVNPVDALRAE